MMIVQLSPRGQLTLPVEARRLIGIEGNDYLMITVEDGALVLSPVVLTPIERFTDERVAEFERAGRMAPEEMDEARRRWGLSARAALQKRPGCRRTL